MPTSGTIAATTAGSLFTRADHGTVTMTTGSVGTRTDHIGSIGRRPGAGVVAAAGTGAAPVVAAGPQPRAEATAAVASPLLTTLRPVFWVWSGSRVSRGQNLWLRSRSKELRWQQLLSTHPYLSPACLTLVLNGIF